MRAPLRTIGFIVAAVTLAACASTRFLSSWKTPDMKPAGSVKGQKVAGFVLTQNVSGRRAGEDALARELTARGAQGIAGYTLIPDIKPDDEATAKAALAKAGVVGVVTMRPLAKEKELTAVSTMWAGPYYGGYWGGYYHYGWTSAWGGVEVRTDTVVSVDTLVYSRVHNKLIWAGQSETTNPSTIDAFVHELVAEATKRMRKDGVI